MILDFIISVLVGTIKLLFYPLPSLPAISPSIETAGDWLITQVQLAAGFMTAIYGSTLLTAIVALFIALLAFEQIYWTVMWILKKIPMLNIK